jgi:hypothetical protein
LYFLLSKNISLQSGEVPGIISGYPSPLSPNLIFDSNSNFSNLLIRDFPGFRGIFRETGHLPRKEQNQERNGNHSVAGI